MAIEEPSAFFHLLDGITDPSVFPLPKDKSSPKHVHKHVFDIALAMDHLAAPGAYVAAEMHVALHSASPKLEAFYQYYNDHHAARKRAFGKSGEECESWVDWYGEVVCDAKTLARLVETEALDPAEEDRNVYVHLHILSILSVTSLGNPTVPHLPPLRRRSCSHSIMCCPTQHVSSTSH